MKKLCTAAAVAVLLTTPALAGDSAAPAREPVKINVSTNGIDLSRPGDVDRLRARLNEAIAEACTPGGNYEAYQTIDPACVQEFSAKADTIVHQIATKASASHLANN